MSSHHIVRDEQEPALIILDLNDQLDVLYALLEWAPTVVVTELALERYLSLGHKLDMALVSNTQLDYWTEQLNAQQPIQIHVLNPEDFLLESIARLKALNHRAINILTDVENRQAIIKILLQNPLEVDLVIFTAHSKTIINRKKVFSKWLVAGVDWSIEPVHENTRIKVSGTTSIDSPLQEEMTFKTSANGMLVLEVNQSPTLITFFE